MELISISLTDANRVMTRRAGPSTANSPTACSANVFPIKIERRYPQARGHQALTDPLPSLSALPERAHFSGRNSPAVLEHIRA
jgi:hypothetical protein